MIGVENFFGVIDGANLFGFFLPRNGQHPVEVISGDGGFGGHGWHGFELLQLQRRLFKDIFRHAGHFNFLLQLVEFTFLAAAQFLLNGLDFLVEVILFLGALHLPLDARLDVAVHAQLFNFNFENADQVMQALDRIEDVEQHLLLFNRQLQVGRDGVGEFAGLFHANGGSHGFKIERLLQLDVLLKQAGDALHDLFDDLGHFGFDGVDAQGSDKEAVGVDNFCGLGALDAFDQHLDVAVGHFDALHDVADGAGGEDVLLRRLILPGIVLGGKKDFAIAGECFFQGAHAGFTADHEGSHHVRKDDHIADRHHRELAQLEIFAGFFHRHLWG